MKKTTKYNKKFQPDKKNLYIHLLKETSKVDENKRIVWELLHDDELNTIQKVEIFKNQTGKSRRTFYRIKKAIEDEEKIDGKNEEITKNTEPRKKVTQNRKSIDNWLSFEHKASGDSEVSSDGDAQ